MLVTDRVYAILKSVRTDGQHNERETEEMTKREFAEFVYENLVWDNIEAVLYNDGFAWARQCGSWGTDEDDILVTVPLGFEYWGESWFFDVMYDYDSTTGERKEKEITDEELKTEIIDGIYSDIFHFGFYDVD